MYVNAYELHMHTCCYNAIMHAITSCTIKASKHNSSQIDEKFNETKPMQFECLVDIMIASHSVLFPTVVKRLIADREKTGNGLPGYISFKTDINATNGNKNNLNIQEVAISSYLINSEIDMIKFCMAMADFTEPEYVQVAEKLFHYDEVYSIPL